MLTGALYRKMVDACHTRSQFEMIYGDMDLVTSTVNRGSKWAERLKDIATAQEDIDMAECTLATNQLYLSTMRGETSIPEFKERIWELEQRYPEVFKRGRIDIGTPEDAVRAIIFRVEYMINRYDVKYPSYDMHKSDDR